MDSPAPHTKNHANSTAKALPNILATDLDGTLIPLAGNHENIDHLSQITAELRRHAKLVFVTGRHYESVVRAIEKFNLPQPDWIICDVGSSIYGRPPGCSGENPWVLENRYADHLQQLCGTDSLDGLREKLSQIDGLRLQEPEKQSRFKLSFYAVSSELDHRRRLVADELAKHETTCEIIASIDPFNNDGLIDLLPLGVSKAYALRWWCDFNDATSDQIVFAGDSGNDLAALTAGYRTIVVGNAHADLKASVKNAHDQHAWSDRLFIAPSPATSGVLEGCRWFGLFGNQSNNPI